MFRQRLTIILAAAMIALSGIAGFTAGGTAAAPHRIVADNSGSDEWVWCGC